MQENTLAKQTIVKSILFVIGFWASVGALLYGLMYLLHSVDLTMLVTKILGD